MFKVAFSPIFIHPLPSGHRFPMEKYDLLPKQLLHEGTLENNNFFDPVPASVEQVLGVHSQSYVEKLLSLGLSPKEERRVGFRQSRELIIREFKLAGGAIQNAFYALEYACSMSIAGGTHHAFAESGEGFCLLNDIAVAADVLLKSGKAKRILIIDLDVHQGNGTASIFKDTHEVFTFSMHGKTNYPLQKETSDLDVHLENNTEDEEYLSVLASSLMSIHAQFRPDFVFYQSGVDVLKSDKLGKLDLSLKGCLARDKEVFGYCHNYFLPIAVSMGGGYSEDIKQIIEAHSNTFRVAKEFYF